MLRYRFGGKARELTIGRYPDISLAKARELASEERVSIQRGQDVAREKQKASNARAAAWSFRELAQDYITKRFPKLAANTVKQRWHHIDDVIIPKLGSLTAREVEGADVISLVEKVGQRSVSVAELVLTAISEIFKHGLSIKVVTANPCLGISISAICGETKPTRQRLMLTEEELRTILPALPGIGQENALAVKIQLATCVRLGII